MDKRIIEETPSSEVLNDDWFIKDSPTGGTSKILGSNLKDIISGDVENAIDKILSSIATEWRANESYSNGTYVMYEGELYECFVNGSTVGQFKKNTEWLHRTVNSMVKDVIRMIAQRFHASTVSPPSLTPYSKGDLVWYSQPYHEDELYICKQDLPNGDTEWVPEHWDKVTDISGLSKYLMDKIAEAGQIDDVQVKTTGDYESVVDENKVAKIDLSNVLIEKSVPNLPQTIATFNDGSDLPLKSLTVSIEPVQDLHGYDSPWAGGAGKNKLPMTVDGIKSANASGTWSGNVYTINSGTFTILTDNDGNVTGIKVNGTFNANTLLTLGKTSLNGSYILNGCPNGGYMYTYRMDLRRSTGGDILYTDEGSGVNIDNINESAYVVIRIQGQYQANNLIFLPMIRLATETDTTFEPYSNICPISGWTEEVITVTDDLQNPTVTHTTTIPFTDSQGNPVEVYGGSVDVVNGGENPITLAKVDLGTLRWIKNSGRFEAQLPDNSQTYVYNSDLSDLMSEMWTPKVRDAGWNNMTDGQYGITERQLRIKYSSVETTEEFAALVNGSIFLYPLATPTTFYTQPTAVKSLDGDNNVSASTGEITKLEYIANATDVIANLEARVTALES